MVPREASVCYDKENIQILCKMIIRQFHRSTKYLLLALAVTFVTCGFYVGIGSSKGMILAFVGCIMIPNCNYQERALINQMQKVMTDWWPTVTYTFHQKDFATTTDKEMTRTTYSKIIKLVTDGSFLYLFNSKQSAFMIDVRKYEQGDLEKIKKFLSEKTALTWKNVNKRKIRIF